jgi:hypothetical protein
VFSEQVLGVAFKWDHKNHLVVIVMAVVCHLAGGAPVARLAWKTVLNFTLSGFRPYCSRMSVVVSC